MGGARPRGGLADLRYAVQWALPGLASHLPAASSASSLKAAVLFFACAALSPLIAAASSPVLYGIVGALAAMCVVPAWIDYTTGRLDPFETLHVIALRYFVFFGLGAIWAYEDPKVAYDLYVPPFVTEAAFYCLLGYGALLLGYGFAYRRPARRAALEVPASLGFLLVPGALGFVGSIASAVWAWSTWTQHTIPALVSSLGQLAPLYNFSWALCWMMILSRRVSRARALLLVALFVPATAANITMNVLDKSMAVAYVAVPLIAWWYSRRSLPWRSLLLLLLVLIFVVFPVFNAYRIVDTRMSLPDRLRATSMLIGEWDQRQYVTASVTATKYRLAMINSVAIVVRDVGRWVPHANGATLFGPAMSAFVPRVFWRDKPWHTLGREFGVTFRIVNAMDDRTSITLTEPGELYWNFGAAGVVAGCLVWGMLLAALYRRYGMGREVDPVRQAVHILVLIHLVHFGGGIVFDLVLLLRTLVIIEAYFWIARRIGWLSRGAGMAAASR